MPAEFELDFVNRIVRSRAWGEVTDGDLLIHLERIRELFSDETLDPTWTQIADFAATEILDGLSDNGLRRLAKQNPWPEGSWRALIAKSDLMFGLGRMYQLLGETKGDYVGVVRSEEEAMAWIAQEKPAPPESS